MNKISAVLHGRRRNHLFALAAIPLMWTGSLSAQDDVDDGEDIEEITVTGTQIKGARISDALAVSVVSAEDIELLGVESGDELLDAIPELGQNFFSETDTAGGVNAARGDVGAINMRNLGTGNTLVLLNGRRLVNMATYQTEVVGGSFVPVNSVNSNHIPVYGVERIEVLRDGASAIYGADAVAGVLNTVLKNDFEGFNIRARYTAFDNLPREDDSIALEWGQSFNGGATHIGITARHYNRGRVSARDDERWANADLRHRFPDSSPFSTSTRFRNDSINSGFGQFDILSSVGSTNSLRVNDIVDSSGEFEIFPLGDARCDSGGMVIDLGYGTCLHEDGQGVIRYNLNEERDLLSELERTTVYFYANHELDNAMELFADGYYYSSDTNRSYHPSTDLTAVTLRVGATNYYNPLGAVGSPFRLPDSIVGPDLPVGGYDLRIDNHRFVEAPRIVNVEGESYRALLGIRGELGSWDWESAYVYSEATRDDITSNRVSNTLITLALQDPTPNAYNPFSGGIDSNIEQALVDVSRHGKTTLGMWDVKFSNGELFEMPAGPVGFVAGYEYRRETYMDDRDDRLDGTIRFMRDTDGDGVPDFEGDFEGDTYPLTSDVVNSSPTPDGAGSRKTHSVFGELSIPLHETIDVQVAARYEDFDDIGDTTVGKVAFGWRPIEQLLVRGSWSEAFRAPNLITINERFVARSNTRDDWVCFYAEDNGGLNADCDYGVQRQATGSTALVPEESTNTSIGFVVTPTDNLTFTFDYWTIEKDGTIGLFGEENHILYDLVLRLQAGTSNCASVAGNPDVLREAHDPTDTALVNAYMAAGLCPVGDVTAVTDTYTNLDTRSLSGYDIGLYYSMETNFGDLDFKWNGSYYDEFEQSAGGALSTAIQEAKANDPTITYPIAGLGDLLGLNGNQTHRQSASVNWRYEEWSAGLTAFRISGFYQVLGDGSLFDVSAMSTVNGKVDYRFEAGETDMRFRLGINNIADRRAPIYDSSYGFSQDAHRDWGRYWYIDLMASF